MPQASAVTGAGLVPVSHPFVCTLDTGDARAARVQVAGEIDLLTSPVLAETLREAELHAHLVVLDTREVRFIDSSGVHVILGAGHDFEWGGARLMVVPGRAVQRMLALCGVSGQVTSFDLSPDEPSREPVCRWMSADW